MSDPKPCAMCATLRAVNERQAEQINRLVASLKAERARSVESKP